MTPETLHAATGCGLRTAERFAAPLARAFAKYGILSTVERGAFLGQIAHESTNFSVLEESLNYSVDALLSKFGRHRISEASARALGRTDGRRADQQSIANTLYGGNWGRQSLGNTQPNDGWHFRGRGLKQLTGRTNYTDYERASGLPVRAKPELLLMPEHACDSAAWFWATKGCAAPARARNWAELTRRINGGAMGLQDRIQRMERAIRALDTLSTR